MAYVPAVPGFSPVTYGQGYGDWQQYAGYGKDNPFGASPSPMSKREKKGPIAPPQSPAFAPQQMNPVDYSIAPTGQMGGPVKTQLGNFSDTQFGQVPDLMSILKKDEEDF